MAVSMVEQQPGCGPPNFFGCQLRLYVKTPGQQPRYACILPNGEASNGECSAGSGPPGGLGFSRMRVANVTNALSADGRRLYWTASSADGPIYLRENPLGEGSECAEEGAPCTTPVSKAAEALSKTTASHFWTAAKDGSRAVFSTGADLYEYEVEGEATQKIAGGFKGVVGASEDATRLYFASTEAIAGSGQNSEGDEAKAGEPNLYLREAGSDSYRFVATLAGADVSPPKQQTSSATAQEPSLHNGRVSPDGAHAAFMSVAPVTGYDNADAASGQADNEAFLYDAGANGGTGEILCASCNPSGARPAGRNFGSKVDPFWIAARLPVFETTLYAPRVLAEDGSRLYFESQDALTPRDTNGRVDVYQWEEPGAGSCDEGDVTFSGDAGGCIELVSLGKSLTDSLFLDAGPTGEDVFFTTLSGLLPEDYGLLDVYDARVGGGFPSPPAPQPECEGETCRHPPGAPELTTPATSSFRGAGDPTPVARRPRPRCPKGKRRVSRAGKSRCAPKRKSQNRKHSRRRAAR